MKEKDLLSSFLLGNELHDSITLQQFTMLFPTTYRSHPQVKDLYRAYLDSRHQVKSRVKRNIDIEVRRNPFQLVSDQNNEQGTSFHSQGLQDGVTDMDIEDVDKHLTLDQAIQELSLAEKIYKEDIARIEKECTTLADQVRNLDTQMESIQVPSASTSALQRDDLTSGLQELIRLCDSITERMATE